MTQKLHNHQYIMIYPKQIKEGKENFENLSVCIEILILWILSSNVVNLRKAHVIKITETKLGKYLIIL